MLPVMMSKAFHFGDRDLTLKTHLPLFVTTSPCISIALSSVCRTDWVIRGHSLCMRVEEMGL